MRYPVLLMVSLASCSLLVACNKSDQATSQGGAAAAQQKMPPTIVNVQAVNFQTIPLTKQLSGKVVAYQEATVTPQVSGIIDRQLFREGAFVKQNQPLYQINSDNYTNVLAGSRATLEQNIASINTAKANYNNALAVLESRQAELALVQTNLNRLKQLRGTDAISSQEYDQGATQVRTAQAAVKNAQAQVGVAQANIEAAQAAARGAQQSVNNNQLNMNRTVVKAPISGITSRATVNVGALATAGSTQMVTISQLNPIYVDISQSSAEMLALRQQFASGTLSTPKTAQVQLKLADGSTYPVIGQLRFEEAKVDSTTGTVNLRAVFSNDNFVLLPGMMVNAELIQGIINNAVLLPQSAIIRTAKGESTVYVVDANSKVQVRPVTVQGTYQGQWIVTSGLKQGEQVVMVGAAKVKPDQAVKVMPYNASATAATNMPTSQPTGQAKTAQP
ncbi:MAG: efflux RND transporter periplasmic adaptor subunit [Moraxella sp.]